MLLRAEQIFSVYPLTMLWGIASGDSSLGIKLAATIAMGRYGACNTSSLDLASY
jgi:hypothetical protein